MVLSGGLPKREFRGIYCSVKILAYTHRSGREIAHASFIKNMAGGYRKGMEFYHLADKTPMTFSIPSFRAPHFSYDPNSLRAEKSGVGLGLVNPEHELAQAALAGQKQWVFQHKGNRFVLDFDSILDDAEIKCADKFVFIDVVGVISPICKYHTQFRGRVHVLINSDPKTFESRNKKRLAVLKNSDSYVVILKLPAALTGGKLPYTPARLAHLKKEIEAYIANEPEVIFFNKPGWCEGERVAGGVAHNDPLIASSYSKLDFSKRKKPKSAQDRAVGLFAATVEKITSMVAAFNDRKLAAASKSKDEPKFKMPLE